MKEICAAVAMALGSLAPATAQAQQDPVERFAAFPDEIPLPRGIAADPDRGVIFVTNSFPATERGFLLRVDASDGRVLGRLELDPAPRLGLAFNPRDRQLYMTKVGGMNGTSTIQRVPADFGPATPVEDIAVVPAVGAPPPRPAIVDGVPIPTSIAFVPEFVLPTPVGLSFGARDGALFFNDQLQGALFRIDDPTSPAHICPHDSRCVTTLIQSGLLSGNLSTSGLALSADQRTLFASSGIEGRLFRLDLTSADPRLEVLRTDAAAPDGLLIGPAGALVVADFGADRVLVIDPDTGETQLSFGSFGGIDGDGLPIGLIGPVQLTRIDDSLFVSCFALRASVPGIIARIRLPESLETPSALRISDPRLRPLRADGRPR